MLGFLDPKVWIALALTALLAYGAGFGTRALHSVSNTVHDKTVAELATLKASVTAANEKAKVDRERDEAISKSAAAAAEVAVTAARVQADSARAESSRLLAQDYARLHSIAVPDSVRDAYTASIRLAPKPDANPGVVPEQSPATRTAPLTLDVYVGVCSRNADKLNELATYYDALYELAQRNILACNRSSP